MLDVPNHLLAGFKDDDGLLAILGEGDVVQIGVPVQEPVHLFDARGVDVTAEAAALHPAKGVHLGHIQAAQALALLVVEHHGKIQCAVGEGVLILGTVLVKIEEQVHRNANEEHRRDDGFQAGLRHHQRQTHHAQQTADHHHQDGKIVHQFIHKTVALDNDFFQKTIHQFYLQLLECNH